MIPPDYTERVYAGVLGKLIGVYLGRPIEGWSYQSIVETFGEIDRYVHDDRGRRLIVTDDDISGTFTFLRALENYPPLPSRGEGPGVRGEGPTPAQIGETWRNYIIEGKTILWWGGMGNSTEHTAFLRLKRGIDAPASGSIALNGLATAEQIGAQIFIDGWGMVAPGDPERAADFARRAASVSHDGEAINGAQVVAAMVAAAFTETTVDRLIDLAVAQIPADCAIRRLIDDLRAWHATGEDWRATRERLAANYGYDRYPGVCHMIPNHGLVILALLHGAGDFDESMKIVNTCGWDTDCNAGNVGCVVGVLRGLDGISAKWRDPVADRLYLPTADGGRSITDAVRETYEIVRAGYALSGETVPVSRLSNSSSSREQGVLVTRETGTVSPPRPRFDFSLPNSVQGWTADGHGCAFHESGALRIDGRASTPTFIPPHAKDLVSGYVLVANPTLYPGQTVRARIREGQGRLFLSHYGPQDESHHVGGPVFQNGEATWTIPEVGGYPIHEIGVEGEVLLESLDWQGVPQTRFPRLPGTMATRAWTSSLDRVDGGGATIVQNEGIGFLTLGEREWRDYRVLVRLTPRLSKSAGLVVRSQGLRRYMALAFGPGEVRWERCLGERTILSRAAYAWEPYREVAVIVEARGNEFTAWIDGQIVLRAQDDTFGGGAFGFFVEEGCLNTGVPEVAPV